MWMGRWQFFAVRELDPLPPLKVFVPKHNLPVLTSYAGTATNSFWGAFPTNYSTNVQSMVNGYALRNLAHATGFPDNVLLEKVCKDLISGAVIGCTGEFRKPGRARNAPSAIVNGEKVTDCIADWVSKKFAYGPVRLDQVPACAKFNSLMTRPKPNGSVRIIMNLSAPKGSSVNEGMDSDEFPTSMSSTTNWLEALWKAGRGCRILKSDWSDAYKHVAVCEEDTDLQWFEWLGCGFKETSLVFGGASSAGIFDRLNKVVIYIAARRAGLDPGQVCQVLDDCCAAAPAGSAVLDQFDWQFTEISRILGIKLAPRDDPEKSFAPCTAGIVLGVFYDTVSWTWGIPQEKLCRLLHVLQGALGTEGMKQQELWSLVGKLLHWAPLVPGGRFNLYHLLKANNQSDDPKFWVNLDRYAKGQLAFWMDMLQVCSGKASIPNPFVCLPPWALEVYTDAAGGTCRSAGHGVGAVTRDWWVYMPWSRDINSGVVTPEGKGLDRVMSALELVGPLLGLCAAARICRGGAARFWVDNAGSVFIWKKGYSTTCPLSTTLVTALACVAAGLGCRVELVKIERCSVPLAHMADALSKGDFRRFRRWEHEDSEVSLPAEPLKVPKALLKWIQHPMADWSLGEKLLKELSLEGPVLGY